MTRDSPADLFQLNHGGRRTMNFYDLFFFLTLACTIARM